jgi:hypothetical protein
MNLWLIFVWLIAAVILQLVLISLVVKIISNQLHIIKHILEIEIRINSFTFKNKNTY